MTVKDLKDTLDIFDIPDDVTITIDPGWEDS